MAVGLLNYDRALRHPGGNKWPRFGQLRGQILMCLGKRTTFAQSGQAGAAMVIAMFSLAFEQTTADEQSGTGFAPYMKQREFALRTRVLTISTPFRNRRNEMAEKKEAMKGKKKPDKAAAKVESKPTAKKESAKSDESKGK